VGGQALHICGLVAYDGTDYKGFQYQVGVPTVQGTLEQALASFATVRSRVAGAGRTDSGVHASGQVVSVWVEWRHSLVDLQQAWNAHLPRSIAVHRCKAAPAEFHPRFDALWRTYRYSIVNYGVQPHEASPRSSPLTDRYALFEIPPLDLAAMQAAAMLFVGEHDFATFGTPTQGLSTVRRVVTAQWEAVIESLAPLSNYPGRRLVFTITANGFLRQMVRTMVGMLLEVGRGRQAVEGVATALAARSRRAAVAAAPPHGLVLERVIYPEHLDIFSE
jgi:tRNA pseudouridine38-40 synthase